MRHTHTIASLEVSRAAYEEIANKLVAAGYSHAIHDGIVDMHGIGLTVSPNSEPVLRITGSELRPGVLAAYRPGHW